MRMGWSLRVWWRGGRRVGGGISWRGSIGGGGRGWGWSRAVWSPAVGELRGRKSGEPTVGELYEGVQEGGGLGGRYPRILFLYPLYKLAINY